jgi:site-specific DNA-methyltransferase (adenine-specific)
LSKWVLDDIIRADSHTLTEFIKPNSVALTVTSPPYRNAIDYEGHIEDKSENYRGKKVWSSLDNYLKDMKEIFDQVYKVTIDGGYCAIVIGLEVINAEIIPLPFYLTTELLKGKKWRLREEIIWNKVTAGRNGAGNRFGITIRNPYPCYYHANVMHEHILIFSKGDTNPRLRKEASIERVEKLNIHELMKRDIANSTWHITPVPPRTIKHPCPFPEQIPWRLIQLYTYVNDVVLDPLNGSGQTTKVAKYLSRHYIGVDILEDYVELAKARLNEPLHLSNLLYVKPNGWGSLKKWQHEKEQAQLST